MGDMEALYQDALKEAEGHPRLKRLLIKFQWLCEQGDMAHRDKNIDLSLKLIGQKLDVMQQICQEHSSGTL